MARVRSRDTGPEVAVRTLLHQLAYRFRLNDAKLPGSPDIVLSKHRKVIWVHGCFWHGHTCRKGAQVPRTNTKFWIAKIAQNKVRDNTAVIELEKRG